MHALPPSSYSGGSYGGNISNRANIRKTPDALRPLSLKWASRILPGGLALPRTEMQGRLLTRDNSRARPGPSDAGRSSGVATLPAWPVQLACYVSTTPP